MSGGKQPSVVTAMDLRILRELADAPTGELATMELVERLGFGRWSTTHACRRMAARGWLVTRREQDGKRHWNEHEITLLGTELVSACARVEVPS